MTSLMPKSREDKLILLSLLRERERRIKENAWKQYFPDTGPYRRDLYQKHLEFFRAGKYHRERMFIAANRVGKTESAGGYETMLHLTGLYPEWWPGRKFNRAVQWWAAGDTAKTVRDIIQRKLLGPWNEQGTGLIPKSHIVKVLPKQGIGEAADVIQVKSVFGGISQCVLKSYDQRRESFQGTEQDGILLDEECPLDIYTECLLRTMTNDGMLMLTFTPLSGLTELVQTFLADGKMPDQVPV